MMVDKDSLNLKIIDFGTAIKIKPGTKERHIVGTSYYIAPEVLCKNYNEKNGSNSCVKNTNRKKLRIYTLKNRK